MTDEIKLSIIIPAYNAESFIVDTLKSVCEQTYPYFEVIIIDDCSTDGTVAFVHDFLRKYPQVSYQLIKNEKNLGAGATRNKGIQAAKYDWIACLDSDDYWVTHKLARVVEAIKQHDTNYVFHNEIYVTEDKQYEVDYIARYDATIHPFIALIRQNFLSPTSATIHKSLFEQAGVFDVSLRSVEDYDLWLRMSLVGLKLCPLPEYLAYYRVRAGSMTSNVDAQLESLLTIIARYKEHLNKMSGCQASKELRRWRGSVYSGCGLMYFRKKDYMKGIFYMIYGQFFRPRLDWVKKALHWS